MSTSPRRSPRSSQSHTPQHQTVGRLAEAFVARWLVEQGYEILQERWRCRWGELDLVVRFLSSPATLAFVEVKARTDRNWDANGLLSITAKKREKLWQAAELFLSAHPPLATLPCRFDVALVHYQINPHPAKQNPAKQNPAELFNEEAIEPGNAVQSGEPQWEDCTVQMGQPVAIGPYRLTLQDYILNGFDEC
ncbi:YraN family protein [Egbenema bharatensis]|uniref:YraN family protein n=1 Tax=Egbenema bharatensis TaxID=3463334 RepID=UPI003A87D54D